MVALAYRRRALPLTWIVLLRQGTSHGGLHMRLLGRIYDLLPPDAPVVVLGDGEFTSAPLIVWLDARGWDFILRASYGTAVYLAGRQRWHVAELPFDQTSSDIPIRIRLPIGYYPVYGLCFQGRRERAT